MYPTSHTSSRPALSPHRLGFLLALVLLGTAGCAHSPTPVSASADPGRSTSPSPATPHHLPVYRARFDRPHPVVAIVGENSGTELTDFAIPYGVLRRSEAAEVVSVSTQPGVLRMRPALTVQPDATIAEFDTRFPQGADYVIVPAVVQFKNPALLAWVKAQGEKGATVMSICDGAAVVAGTGLMDGRRATAHWASAGNRQRLFPRVNWIADVRYIADGPVISTAGISAALPASLALVEAIAGRERALTLARELGVSDWSSAHDTAPFRPKFGVNVKAHLAVTYTNRWFNRTDQIGLQIADGVDEIALAVTADAYSRTGRSLLHALAASSKPVRTRAGMMIVPDTMGAEQRIDFTLPDLDGSPSADAFPQAIEGIGRRYGLTTAYGVALNFEYPLIPHCPAANPAENQ